jgi:hypothetical protein
LWLSASIDIEERKFEKVGVLHYFKKKKKKEVLHRFFFERTKEEILEGVYLFWPLEESRASYRKRQKKKKKVSFVSLFMFGQQV